MHKYFNIIGLTEGVNAAATIANTISGIVDAGKRREMEQALSYLSSQQRAELERQVAAANTQTDRLQILSAGLVQFAIANEASGNKSKTSLLILAAVLSVVVLTAAIVLLKTKD